MIPYGKTPKEKVNLPSRDNRKRYDDRTPMRKKHVIPEIY